MSQLVCSVAGLRDFDAMAFRRAMSAAESQLEDSWTCSSNDVTPDVELIDVDIESGRQIWASHRLEPPLAVALSARDNIGEGWSLHKPIEPAPVASLFNELGHTLRGVSPSAVPSILLAHGDDAVLAAVRQSVGRQPFSARLQTASSGKDAVAILESVKVGLAVVVMPLRNGFELLAALRDKFPDTLRVVCGGPGVGIAQIPGRCRRSLAGLHVMASLDTIGRELLGALDLEPAGTGFFHRCSTWTPSGRRPVMAAPETEPAPARAETPLPEPAPPPVLTAPISPLSRRDQLASEVMDFELTHLARPLVARPDLSAPVAIQPLPEAVTLAEPPAPVFWNAPPKPKVSFEELVEEGFRAFRAKDYARAEECLTEALERQPDDGLVAYNLRMVRKRREQAAQQAAVAAGGRP